MRAARIGWAGGLRRGVIAAASVVVLASVGAAPAWAATGATFAPHVDYPTGTLPRSVAVGDFNRDGNRDLATANSDADTVSVLLGTVGTTFNTKTDYPTGDGPYSVTVADFNGDGNRDLATANSGAGTVSVLLGKRDGTFNAKTDYPTGLGPQSVTVGDFNGDGNVDLATANFDVGTVSVLLGDGDGTFTKPNPDYATGTNPVSVAVGDFNRDGTPDLATADFDAAGTVSVLLGNGDGTFKANTDLPIGARSRSVAVGDFNGDGSPDLATANPDANTASVLLGNGDGTFKAHIDHATGASPQSVAVGDFNVDGNPDLATANSGAGTVSVLLGNGDGTFKAKSDHATDASPVSVAVGDFNVDGNPDLATANYNTPGTVSVLLNTTDTAPPSVTITTPSNGAAYAQGQTVKADYACADELGYSSGMRSCQGPVPDGDAIDTDSQGSHSFTVTATDNAGNTQSLTMTYTVSDQTAPSVSITTPADGASYPQGQALRASYACRDNAGGSGVASCPGPVANGDAIDTGSLGSHSFTVTTTDRAGNTTSKTVHYAVITAPPAPPPPPPAATPPPPVVSPPTPSVAALASWVARVGHRGVVRVRMSCTGPDGDSCAGRLLLETAQSVPHRAVQPRKNARDAHGTRERRKRDRRRPGLDLGARSFALAAGHTARVRVRLNRHGRRVFSTLTHVRVRARLEATPGTRTSDRQIVVRASRAPSATVRHPTQIHATHAGRTKVRVLCHAPGGKRCHGQLQLADRSGRALATRQISIAGHRQKTVTVRLKHSARRRLEKTSRLCAHATTTTTIPVGLTTTRKRHITIRPSPA